jgi:sentrin-specific protease 1
VKRKKAGDRMTILGNKSRRENAWKGVRRAVTPRKHKRQKLVPTHMKLRKGKVPRVSEATEEAIRSEVIDLLKDTGSVTLMNMASALYYSKKIKDEYTMQHEDQNPCPSFSWRNLWETLGRQRWKFAMNGAALFVSKKIKDEHANHHPGINTCSSFSWKNFWETLCREKLSLDMKSRYQLATIFTDLRKLPLAEKTIIESWKQAKMLLSTRIDFPERRVGQKVFLPDSELRSSHFRKYLDCGSGGPFQSSSIHQHQSNEKNIQVKEWRSPRNIEDEAKDESKEAGTLATELDSRYVELVEPKKLTSRQIERTVADIEKGEETQNLPSALLREFTADEEAIIENAMYGGGAADGVMQSEGTDSVYRKSIRRLRPGKWLNDEVINFFYLMLGKRDEVMCRIDPDRKRSHFFKSFFVTTLLNTGHSKKNGQYEYRNVKRWSKKVPGNDIFKLDKIFFPINQHQQHWVCAVAFMQENRIQVYDSMGGGGKKYLKHIFQYIQDEHLDKRKSTLPDMDEWRLVECTDDTPQQKNGKRPL